MNINKTAIIEVLHDNPNEFLTVKSVMATLNLSGEKSMRRVSRELGRIYRRDTNVEREKCSFAFAYRFVKSPAKTGLFVESPKKHQAKKKEKESKLSGYTYIEELEEPEYGFCDLCNLECELTYRAETSRGVDFLCEGCGAKVNEKIGGYGGAFQ